MVTAPGAISAGETTAPATLAVPFPGLYGTQEAIHAPLATLLKTPLIVSSALYTFAPKVARPGVPAGTSGGGRQIDDERRAELRLRLREEVRRHGQRLPRRRQHHRPTSRAAPSIRCTRLCVAAVT